MSIKQLLFGNRVRHLSELTPKRSLLENSTILSQLKEMEAGGNTLGFLFLIAHTDQYWNDPAIREAALLLAEKSIIKVPVTDIKASFHPKIEAGLIANGGTSRICEAFDHSDREDKGAERCFQKRYAQRIALHQPTKSSSKVVELV